MSRVRMLAGAPGTRRAIACLHGQVRYIDPRWRESLQRAGLHAEADWRHLAPGEAVSSSKVTNCFRVPLEGGECVYFKRYVYTRYKKWRFFLRPGRAATEVFGYRQLRRIGIDSLEVLAFSEERWLGRLVSACVVTRGIPHSRDLARFAAGEWQAMDAAGRAAALDAIRRQVFDQLGRAHAADFFHQDLHWRNLLLTGDDVDSYRVYWIDCPRARYQHRRRQHAVLADLSTLSRIAPRHLTPRQRMQSLCAWLGEGRPYRRARRWFERITRHHPPD